MRCFFNLAGAIYDPDYEGFEVATIDQARAEATRFLAGTLNDSLEAGWCGQEIRIEVTDDHRKLLFTMIAFGVDAPVSGQPDGFRPIAQV